MGMAMPTELEVEDDEDTRQAVAGCLRDAGHRVTALGDLDAALAALAEARVDAIVTDAARAGGGEAPDLWHVPDALQAAAPGVPHVFANHRARGFVDVLPKPFDLDALVDVVGRCLAPR